jgi:hypothetical protein
MKKCIHCGQPFWSKDYDYCADCLDAFQGFL